MAIAAVYVRKSREDKDKPAHRLTVQREQLPDYARLQGWQVEVYDDGHASAAKGKIEELKERARLERDIKAGKIDVVLVIELSRLSRDESLQDYTAWLALCAQYKVRLATPARMLDPSQPSDWMLLLMEGGFSSVEMKVLQARMREGRQEAFQKGRFLGGTPPPPYVYDRVIGKPVIDQGQLLKMKRLLTLTETMSAKAVAKKLKLPEIFVRRAISDERLLFYQSLRKDPVTGNIIPCEWEPCMDADQAERIRRSRRTRKTNTERREYAALLSNLGVLYCGYCGKTVKTWRNSKVRLDGTRLDYYGCQSKNDKTACNRSRLIPQIVLDEKVLSNAFTVLGNLEDIKRYWLLEQSRSDPARELEKLEAAERKEKERKDRLVLAISEGIIEPADAKGRMADINAVLTEIQERRKEIMAQINRQPDWDSLDLCREEFDQLDDADKRTFLQLVIDTIHVYRNYAIIHYPFPCLPSGARKRRIHLPAPKRGGRKARYEVSRVLYIRVAT